MALTQDRKTARRSGHDFSFPMKAGTIYAGALVVMDAGLAMPGFIDNKVTAVGVAKEGNSCSVDGEQLIKVEKGFHRFNNSAGGEMITLADVGREAWIIDDETVAKGDGAGARSPAGIIADVDEFGVWIKF
ncbi:hypothetical protein [Kiloniella litopenaei]|uniref:hypothetical protein n=1 Tax=Kiloniella litopenaei TaxID=1549748 RepID=UPI003BAB050D